MPRYLGRQGQARKLIYAALGNRGGYQVWSTFDKWTRESGEEWAVKRLKALWTAALQLRAGNLTVVKQIYQDESIAYNKRTLIVKGPFGEVMRVFLNANRPSTLRRMAAVFRVYTSIRLTRASNAQIRKTIQSITGPNSGVETGIWRVSENHPWVAETVRELKILSDVQVPNPNLSRLKGLSSYHREMTGCGISREPWGKAVLSLISSVYIPQSLQGLNPDEELRAALEAAGCDTFSPGHLALLQEGGAKGRVVAVPNVWCQLVFEPLHRCLNSLIKRLPNSAVHDQCSGGWYLQNHLTSGVHCFDLSSATDRFPRSLQMEVLKALGLDSYAEALDEISSKPWKLIETGEYVSYTVGQPMGLYGSFPLFHLSHWLLLYYCTKVARSVKPDLSNLPFMVLGDDVIITDADVASLYKDALCTLGVDVSPTKSINSARVGEFAGFLSIQTLKGVHTFRPYKHSKEKFITSPLNLMYSIGSKVRVYSPYWEKMFKLFSQTTLFRDLDLAPLNPEGVKEIRNTVSLDSFHLDTLLTRVAMMAADAQIPDEFPVLWKQSRKKLLDYQEQLSRSSVSPLVGQRDLKEGFSTRQSVMLGTNLPTSREDERPLSVRQRIRTDPIIQGLLKREKVKQREGSILSSST